MSREYIQVTREIRVSVLPAYLEGESSPEHSRFIHSYRITLENLGEETVQLINRHWKVFSGGRQIADVKGEGVVGEQPVLEGGQRYQYSSWTAIGEPSGTMIGTYTFISEEGLFFDVVVPEFDLISASLTAVH